MPREIIRALGVGAVAAVLTYALDPTPPWWLVGMVVTVVLLANPCNPR